MTFFVTFIFLPVSLINYNYNQIKSKKKKKIRIFLRCTGGTNPSIQLRHMNILLLKSWYSHFSHWNYYPMWKFQKKRKKKKYFDNIFFCRFFFFFKLKFVSVGTSDFDLITMCEIMCSVGHVFEALVEAEEVAAELIGHCFDALLPIGFTLRLHSRIFGRLVIQSRLTIAVAVGRRGRRDRRHRRHRIDRRAAHHRRALRRRYRRRRCGRCSRGRCGCAGRGPDQLVFERVEHRVETVQVGRLHVADHCAAAARDPLVQLGIAADRDVHEFARDHDRVVHVGYGAGKALHGEHDRLLREFRDRVVERHRLPQCGIPLAFS